MQERHLVALVSLAVAFVLASEAYAWLVGTLDAIVGAMS